MWLLVLYSAESGYIIGRNITMMSKPMPNLRRVFVNSVSTPKRTHLGVCYPRIIFFGHCFLSGVNSHSQSKSSVSPLYPQFQHVWVLASRSTPVCLPSRDATGIIASHSGQENGIGVPREIKNPPSLSCVITADHLTLHSLWLRLDPP